MFVDFVQFEIRLIDLIGGLAEGYWSAKRLAACQLYRTEAMCACRLQAVGGSAE